MDDYFGDEQESNYPMLAYAGKWMLKRSVRFLPVEDHGHNFTAWIEREDADRLSALVINYVLSVAKPRPRK